MALLDGAVSRTVCWLGAFSHLLRLGRLIDRKTHKSRKLLVQAGIDEDTRGQHRTRTDYVLLRLDGVRLVVQQITDNGPGYLTCRRVKLEPGALGVGTQLEELVVVLGLGKVAQDRGRAGPLDVLPVRLVPVTGQGHAGKLSPGLFVRVEKHIFDELVTDGFVEGGPIGAEERLCFVVQLLPFVVAEERGSLEPG